LGAILQALLDRGTTFGLDIGTQPGDLPKRLALVTAAASTLAADSDRVSLQKMLHFSLGLWPGVPSIEARATLVPGLEADIRQAQTAGVPVIALGECGLDHHWNPAGVDGRDESDFDAAIIKGEAELFEMQLSLARTLALPVIVHSRDAFAGTLGCIKDVGYDNGVIHCFSYGRDEARAFLDRGWPISLSGAVTYTKKSHLDDLRSLLAYIPRDRLLLETDAPYLAPVPHRGEINTPLLVEHIYRYVAELLEVTPEALSVTVDENAKKLFGLTR
jgi:TatD DNase family protein